MNARTWRYPVFPYQGGFQHDQCKILIFLVVGAEPAVKDCQVATQVRPTDTSRAPWPAVQGAV